MSTIKEELERGIVTFKFTKKDGSERIARGTRCFDNPLAVGENYVPPKGTGVEKPNTISYWDLDKEAWRCFNESSYIETIEIQEL